MLTIEVQKFRKSLVPNGPFKQLNQMPATSDSGFLDV